MTTATQATPYGATLTRVGAEFRVWAPRAGTVELLRWPQAAKESDPERVAMRREPDGTFVASTPARVGELYQYRVDGLKAADPVSRLLPQGVHGRTEIVDPDAFRWTDAEWRGRALRDYVIYELHVGTFSPEGTFAGVAHRLDYLWDLGITAIELMPVSAFPGERDWGYDGASPYAVQSSYGGPEELKKLVDAAHACGLAVLLDVVYNHLGPEGNYLRQFGPYFTDKHTTPWGEAVNYDQAGSEGVRRYFVENALYWIREYHLDGLRLDAVQTIQDDSANHILAEIADAVHALGRELGREVCVIAESDENERKLVLPPPEGYGLDAQWSDDFHHAVHALFTGERQRYYQDFGAADQIVRALNEGFVLQGEEFKFWGRPRGTPAAGLSAASHVVCVQNHDQVGNRARGERISVLVPRGAQKAMAALLLLSPHTPLLFMGEEYGEAAPFQFFTSFGDPPLRAAVREGRRREFGADVPAPEDLTTFAHSKLDWRLALHGHNELLKWYRELLALRKRVHGECRAELQGDVLVMWRESVVVMASLVKGGRIEAPPGWKEVLCSDEDGWCVRVAERA